MSNRSPCAFVRSPAPGAATRSGSTLALSGEHRTNVYFTKATDGDNAHCRLIVATGLYGCQSRERYCRDTNCEMSLLLRNRGEPTPRSQTNASEEAGRVAPSMQLASAVIPQICSDKVSSIDSFYSRPTLPPEPSS
ncbi:unnamed protein product [Leptosia nina]|uniref:Uncharacterized protein n=1 Tax=Leptosia nina TaxID=320188 RepID=A0AAV1JX37_9NEOP